MDDDDEVGLLRQKLIEIRQSWQKHNEDEVLKRWPFEEVVSFLKDSFVVIGGWHALQHCKVHPNRNTTLKKSFFFDSI